MLLVEWASLRSLPALQMRPQSRCIGVRLTHCSALSKDHALPTSWTCSGRASLENFSPAPPTSCSQLHEEEGKHTTASRPPRVWQLARYLARLAWVAPRPYGGESAKCDASALQFDASWSNQSPWTREVSCAGRTRGRRVESERCLVHSRGAKEERSEACCCPSR